MLSRFLPVVAFLLLAGSASAQALYVGADRLKAMDKVCDLVPGPGGILVGTGVLNGVTYNVVMTQVADPSATIFRVSVIVDDASSTGTGSGLVLRFPTGEYRGKGQGINTVRGLSGGTSYAFQVN